MATPYVEPNTVHNPSVGAAIPADWGDVVRDDLDAVYNPPLGYVYNSAVQTIANATNTVLTFNSEYEDTDGLHSTTVNTGRFTATLAGWYLVIANAAWAANATGQRRVILRKNGTNTGFEVNHDASASGATNQGFPALVDMAAADYVDLVGIQNSGGNLDVTALFQIVRVSGT